MIEGSLEKEKINVRSFEQLTGTLAESVNKLTKSSNKVNIIFSKKFKSRLQSVDLNNRIELSKIAEKHGLESFNKVIEFLLCRYRLVEELMEYCGAKDEVQLKRLCFEHLPRDSTAMKAKLANEFLDNLCRLGLISEEEFNRLAGVIYPILLNEERR